MLSTVSSVVMPRASAFQVAVAPATRVLSVDVPPVSAVSAAVVGTWVARERGERGDRWWELSLRLGTECKW